MGANNLAHAGDQAIEAYAMGALRAEEIEGFEEHLLICEYCRKRLAEADAYVAAAQDAARQIRTRPPKWAGFSLRMPPRAALVLCAAALAVIAVVMPIRTRTGENGIQRIELAALRGSENPSAAKQGTTLELALDLTDLATAPSYTVEVVDAAGDPVYQGRAAVKAGKAVARLTEPLDAGRYWVRLYSDSLKSTLLREYGLTVE